MLDIIKNDSLERMQKSVDALKTTFAQIRTGRVSTSLLDHIMVSFYGSNVPINQAANVTVLDAHTLGVTPWEKNMTVVIEKAILDSDLGLNPTNLGTTLRVPLPPMSEERRKELVKVVRQEAENTRVAVRNIRRDANHEIKGLEKEGDIAKDDGRRAEEEIQKLTNQYITKVDKVLADKEAELMAV